MSDHCGFICSTASICTQMAEADDHITTLAADRSLQPEVCTHTHTTHTHHTLPLPLLPLPQVRKARKNKYHRCKERVGKLSSCFSDCYKQMMDRIDNVDTRLVHPTSNRHDRCTLHLQTMQQQSSYIGDPLMLVLPFELIK